MPTKRGRIFKSRKGCACKAADLVCMDEVRRSTSPMKPYCRCKPHKRQPAGCHVRPGCGWPVEGKARGVNTSACAPEVYGKVLLPNSKKFATYSNKVGKKLKSLYLKKRPGVVLRTATGCVCGGLKTKSGKRVRSPKCCK